MVAGVISLNIDGHIVLCLILWSVSGYIEGHSVLEMSLLDSPNSCYRTSGLPINWGPKGTTLIPQLLTLLLLSALSKRYLNLHIVSTVSI